MTDRSALTLSALQLPLYGGADEIRPVLPILKDGLDPGKRPLGEPSLHVLGPHFFTSHAMLARHGYNPDGSIRSYQPKVWQNQNGTWSHHRDSKREWGDPVACRTDLLFTYEMHPND